MRKSVQIMFHLLFWVFSSLLVILGYQLISFPAAVLGASGPDIQEQFLALLFTLPVGAIIFYSSYFALNYFVKKTIRFIWIAICYVILISVLIIDFGNVMEILIVLFPVLYFNIFGFLFNLINS
ncbi:hypothetical protein [Mariniphaga sp.]|uniref:hypothetical protein n=1 Tax=Mariniphaga sp. TaxID=1954475 RepID=UPI0035697C1B